MNEIVTDNRTIAPLNLTDAEKNILFSQTGIVNLSDEEVIVLHNASCKILNQSIKIRKQNDRDNLTQALKAGRILKEILKPTIAHGEWERYILNNTEYRNVRQAQIDMQIWSAWKPFAEQLVANGVISSDAFLEQSLVSNLDEEAVHISISAMAQFAYKDVPQLALEIALKKMETGGDGFTISGAKKIIEVAKAIEVLPDDNSKKIAQTLVSEHAVDNAEIINEIPRLSRENPQIIKEMVETGTIFVPGVDGDGQHVPLDKASKTDVQIAANRDSIESELVNQYKNKHILPNTTKDNYVYVNTYTGTPAQLKQIFDNFEKTDYQTVFKITLQRRK